MPHKNKELDNARRRAHYENNKERASELQKTRYQKKKKEILEYNRNYKLLRDFGITSKQYDEMLVSQKGCCKLCGKDGSKLTKRLAVDHCHETGAVRGLLCGTCNTALGLFYDNIELMKKAIKYVRTKGKVL